MMKRTILLALTLCLLLSLCLPSLALAAPVSYLPGVTEEMADPAFWSGRTAEPDRVLADAGEIAEINAAALTAEGCNMHDLKNLPETVNGKALARDLRASAEADAKYYLGWTYSADGEKADQAFYDRMIANTADPDARESQPVRYAVAAVRTQLLTFPSEEAILDDPKDPDFDYQNLSSIRVNEPVVLRAVSADGNYYAALTDSASGWVRAADVAVCADRDEWLSAWDIPADRAVVIHGNKVWTAASNFQPETAKRMLTMGVVLELADWPDPENLVANRATYHNYVVYLPVRREDGSYEKRTALLPAGRDVSLGYPPLTAENLANVAMKALGDAYGWGGMLESGDCSGFIRDVYHCFGLALPRNTTWQAAMPGAKADLSDCCAEEKLRILEAMPLGTALYFKGHAMLYLGRTDGHDYVLSSVSSMMNASGDKVQRIRGVVLSTLDVKRASGHTWLQDLHTALTPYRRTAGLPAPVWYHDGVAFCLEKNLIDTADGGRFLPDEPATRAVLVEALWRLAGKPESGSSAPFTDVEDRYRQAVNWAAEAGIVKGISDTRFDPEAAVTREQLAAFLSRCAREAEPDPGSGRTDLSGFPDAAEVSEYAYEAVCRMTAAGVLRGRTGGLLAPRDSVTRAEAAVLLQRAARE